MYINQSDEVYHLVRVRKVLSDMKDLMRSVKRSAEAVGIWTKDHCDVRFNSFHTMVSGRLNFKINKRFDSFSWSLVARDLYTRRGYIIAELNEKQDQDWQTQKKNKR